MSAADRSTLPDWPRLMSQPIAAAYLSVSENKLREQGPKPKPWGGRILYDRKDLDRFADRLEGQPLDTAAEADEAASIEERFLENRKRGRG